MTRFATAALALAVSFEQTRSQVMYPDWNGGTGTCLNNTETPAPNYLFTSGSGFAESTLVSCCTRYYSSAFNSCIVGGGGNVTGSGEYYALWSDNPPRCAADCATTEGTQCGGILGPGQAPSFADAAACCAQIFGSLKSDYCVALAAGGTWGGNGKYYLDSSEHICVRDCEGAAPCGGVVTQSWVSLYDSLADCCTNRLASLDIDDCISQSTPGSTGTNKWFVDGHVCKKDCVGTGDECGNYRVGTLYPDAAACCDGGLNWIQDEFCESRSDPATHGVNGEPYTNMWFVDFAKSVCEKDCSTSSGDATCANIGDGSTDGSSKKLYATAVICCDQKLNWIDDDTCEQTSTLVAAANVTAGSSKWYADYQSARRCVMDCPEGTGSPACGGVVAGGLGVSKYSTVADCCSNKFGWYNQDLCKALSEAGEGNDAQTGMWYVNYQDKLCEKDCIDGAAVSCGGNPSNFGEALYTTASECCSEKLSYLDSTQCESKSENGADSPAAATNLWYANYDNDRCSKDCEVTTAGDPACNGIASTGGEQTFPDIAACCAGKFNWIDSFLCAARSANPASPHTFKFYADQQNRLCKQDCPDGTIPCGGAPTELSLTLHDTIAECCSEDMGWQAEYICQQIPASQAGTDEYYINWQVNKCVKNCDASLGGGCGGLAETWDITYSTSSLCCAQPAFNYRDIEDCVLA